MGHKRIKYASIILFADVVSIIQNGLHEFHVKVPLREILKMSFAMDLFTHFRNNRHQTTDF